MRNMGKFDINYRGVTQRESVFQIGNNYCIAAECLNLVCGDVCNTLILLDGSKYYVVQQETGDSFCLSLR